MPESKYPEVKIMAVEYPSAAFPSSDLGGTIAKAFIERVLDR